MLEEAAEAGMDILREIRRRALEHGKLSPAEAAETLAPEGDLGLVYPRIQRAIRQAVALHARFEEEFRVRERETADEAAARMAAAAQRAAAARNRAAAAQTQERANHKAWQKAQVERAVEKAIGAVAAEYEAGGSYDDDSERDAGDLFSDLYERLDEFNDYSDSGRRPVGEIVENLCSVIGVPFDPAMWVDEPWAVEEAKTKPAGSPYTNWPDPDPEQDNEADEFGLAEVSSTGTGPP